MTSASATQKHQRSRGGGDEEKRGVWERELVQNPRRRLVTGSERAPSALPLPRLPAGLIALLSLLLFVLGGSPFTRTSGTTLSCSRVPWDILREELGASPPELAWARAAVSCPLSPRHVLSQVSFAKHRCSQARCFPLRGAGTEPRGHGTGLVLPGGRDAAGLTRSPPTTSLGGAQPAPVWLPRRDQSVPSREEAGGTSASHPGPSWSPC